VPLPTSLPKTAPDAYNLVVATAFGAKTNLEGVNNLINLGAPVLIDSLIGLYTNLNTAQRSGREIQGVEGLAEYAKERTGDPEFDINTEFMKSIIACKAVTDWQLANMPGDGNGRFFGWEQQPDGSLGDVYMSTEQLLPLAALIATALATFA
jgi:hypothetical protein